MKRVTVSVRSSASMMLNKIAAAEDVFFIQIRASSAAPSAALTCVLLCFLPTTFYYSAFQHSEGNPKVLRDGIVNTET